MTRFERLPETEKKRYEEASAWQLRVAGEPSLEVSAEFQIWLSDPANGRAFDGVTAAWDATEDFAADPPLLDMRQAALRRARDAHVSRLSSGKSVWRKVAAAFIGAVLIGGGAIYYFVTAPNVYSTSTGERRVVVLSDGSQIALDSDTEVSVQYLKNARKLELDRGRARFDVTHDITRPFSVTAGRETVVAVGTEFDVEKIGSKVLVTLIRGKIVVKNGQIEREESQSMLPATTVSLQAGQELVAAEKTKPVIRHANLSIANAWQSGRLIFNGDTLGEAVARENRYTDHPIQVDPAIASVRIVGAFDAGDVSAFVNAVTSYFPVQATTTADNSILLQPRS